MKVRVSPKFQIVVHYPKEQLILHGAISTVMGDISDFTLQFFNQRYGIPIAKPYNFSKEELEKA